MSETDLSKLTGSALVVEPGDMLIIGISQRLTAAEVDRVGKLMADVMPRASVCVLDGVAAMAVVKAGARAAEDARISA